MSDLTDAIRQKYPGKYDDLDDQSLEKAILTKHPQYMDMIRPRATPEALKVDNPEVDKIIADAKRPFADLTKEEPANEKPTPIISEPSEKISSEIEQPSLLKRFSDSVSGFMQNHPRIQEALTGTSPEFENLLKSQGITDVKGPGFMEIPGIQKATDYLANRVTGSEGNTRLALGAITKAAGDLLATGADPRAVGIAKGAKELANYIDAQYYVHPDEPSSLPIRRDIPNDSFTHGVTEYKTDDIPAPEAQFSAPQTNIEVPKENRPTGLNEDQLFKLAQDKFNMGRPLPEPQSQTPITARHIGTQPGYADIEPQELYNIEGGPEHGSTVTRTGLEDRGIEVPPNNESLAGKTGDQIRNEALEAKKSSFKNPFVQQVEEPQAARTSSGKLAIGADVKSLGKVLGTSLYKGDIAPIATKELLQNSIDAVRHLGSEGKVDVFFDQSNNTIHVKDNGKGLTKDELESVFTDLGSSGKREDANAVGGFGLAKAAPLLGGKKVEVTTVAIDPKTNKKMIYSFEGTPDELLQGVDIKQKLAHPDAQTGTSVKVHVPENSGFYDANRFVENLSQHSPGLQPQIRIGNTYIKGSAKDHEELLQPAVKGAANHIATLDSPTSKTDISIPSSSVPGTRSYIKVHLSNNGMFQGTHNMYLQSDAAGIPSDVIVNINSKVPEGHEDYPFTANRESLRGTVEKQVKEYIEKQIVDPSMKHRMTELEDLYNNMPEITIGKGEFPNNFGRKVSLYDPKGQINPYEMDQITKNPTFIELTHHIVNILDEAMNVAGNAKWKERLEKVGIIFDDALHGIHIPNPKTKKSAILINPFIALRDLDPDGAAAQILHTDLHELAHVDPSTRAGHDESFTMRLGEIYAKFGARRSVAAQDKILKTITDPATGEYNSEIQDLLSIYQESRGRTATQTDLLSGTGIGSKSNSGGSSDIPNSNRSNGKGALNSVLNKLFQAMGSLKESRVEQDIINKQERARRFAAFAGVKAEGVKGARQSLSQLRGEYEKADVNTNLDLSDKEVDILFTAIKKAKITSGEKARGYVALFKILEGEGVPQRNELQLLDEVFGNDFANRITEMHGGIGAIGLKLTKTANTMKAMKSTFDLSAPLRQGIGLIHRAEYRDAFKEMFKYYGDKEYYNYAMRAIEADPDFIKSREAGLFLAKHNDLTASEEAFGNNYIGSIPKATGIPMAVDASERAYTGFLNTLRFQTFKNLIENAETSGTPPYITKKIKDAKGNFELDENGNVKTTEIPTKVAEDIAKYINVSTGRGGLGRLEKMAPELNSVLWSPRLISSRLSILNPKYYMNFDSFTRTQAIKSLLAIAAAGTTVALLGKAAGAKVSLNPTSADLGKARFEGNNVVDPWAGFQQPIVAAARIIAESHRMLSGEKKDYNKPNIAEIGQNFLVNKLSPMAALAYQIATAKTFNNKEAPGDISTFGLPQKGGFINKYGEQKYLSTEVKNGFIPMFIQDATDVFKSDPNFAEQVGLDIASLFGMGVQNYPASAQKSAFRKMRIR